MLGRPTRRQRRTAQIARRVWIGRDEWATDRHLDLAGVPGLTCGGLQGYGKTSLALSALTQLAPCAEHQFVVIDGKGGGDYDEWAARAWLATGDDLQTAAAHLERVHQLMRTRLATVRSELGTTNFWDVGPSGSWPLVFVLVDECHTFLPEPKSSMPKGEQEAYRACRHYTEQLVKKGRSVGLASLLMTQKQTGDSIPTFIRDVCEVGLSFACRTRDAAVASLGEGIREHPSVCPTTLATRPDYIGVAVGALPGLPGFVRLRVPYVDPEQAGQLARNTAHLRRDLDGREGGDGGEPPRLEVVG